MEQYLDYLTNNGHIYYPYTRVEGIINADGQPFSVWMSEVNTHNHDIRYASASHVHDNRYSLKTHTHEGYAANNHTHNYAGSDSSGGAANSARALASSFNINITGIGTGSGSTDGTTNVDIELEMTHDHDDNYLKLEGGNKVITVTGGDPDGFGIIGDGVKPDIRLYDTTYKSTYGSIGYSGRVISMGIDGDDLFEIRLDGAYSGNKRVATEDFVLEIVGNNSGSDIDIETLNDIYAQKVHVHNAAEITGIPTYLPNEHTLSINVTTASGTPQTVSYNGTVNEEISISLDILGGARADHYHSGYLTVVDGTKTIVTTEADAYSFGILSDGSRPAITLYDPDTEVKTTGSIDYAGKQFSVVLEDGTDDPAALYVSEYGVYTFGRQLATEDYVEEKISAINGGTNTNSGSGGISTDILDARYASKGHTHDDFAAFQHTHTITDITDFTISNGIISYGGNKLATEGFVLKAIELATTGEETVPPNPDDLQDEKVEGEIVDNSVEGPTEDSDVAVIELISLQCLPDNYSSGYVRTGLKESELACEASTIEGVNNIANAYCTHCEGINNVVAASYAHVEGCNVTATSNAICAHGEGEDTTVSGYAAHVEGKKSKAEGDASHAEGSGCTAIGENSHVGGANSTARANNSFVHGNNVISNGDGAVAFGNYTTAQNLYQMVIGRYNTVSSKLTTEIDDYFVIGNGSSISTRSNAFRVSNTGAVFAKEAYNASGADYAEYFEWADDNTNSDDRRGYFVTMTGNKIKLATSKDTYILGVVSGKPSVIGNSDPDGWHGHFMRDEFGNFIMDENNSYIINPSYNLDTKYIPRAERKEWAAVGMLGVLVVRDDGTCTVDGYCTVSDEGKATSSDTPGYRVIERINDALIRVIFR